jgi:hypothetical protein
MFKKLILKFILCFFLLLGIWVFFLNDFSKQVFFLNLLNYVQQLGVLVASSTENLPYLFNVALCDDLPANAAQPTKKASSFLINNIPSGIALAAAYTLLKPAPPLPRALGAVCIFGTFKMKNVFSQAMHHKRAEIAKQTSTNSDNYPRSVFESFFFDQEFYIYVCIVLLLFVLTILTLIVLWSIANLYSDSLKAFSDKYNLVKLRNFVHVFKKISFHQIVFCICLFYFTIFLCIIILSKKFDIF